MRRRVVKNYGLYNKGYYKKSLIKVFQIFQEGLRRKAVWWSIEWVYA